MCGVEDEVFSVNSSLCIIQEHDVLDWLFLSLLPKPIYPISRTPLTLGQCFHACLTHRYFNTGTVVSGNHIGLLPPSRPSPCPSAHPPNQPLASDREIKRPRAPIPSWDSCEARYDIIPEKPPPCK